MCTTISRRSNNIQDESSPPSCALICMPFLSRPSRMASTMAWARRPDEAVIIRKKSQKLLCLRRSRIFSPSAFLLKASCAARYAFLSESIFSRLPRSYTFRLSNQDIFPSLPCGRFSWLLLWHRSFPSSLCILRSILFLPSSPSSNEPLKSERSRAYDYTNLVQNFS